MVKIDIPSAFEILFKPKRYKVFYGGRGGAKSHNIARALIIKGAMQPLRIVCAREVQKSIRDSVHALLSDIIRKYDLHEFYQIQRDLIKGSNGTEFKFIGLKHNVTDIKSLEAIDILWIEEAENVSDQSYEVIIPTIRKDKSEIWVSFNPKSVTDPTYRRFITNKTDDMIVKKVSWRDNPFFPEVLEKERQKLFDLDKDAYDHIWEGQPDVRKTGSVHAKLIAKARDEGRICKVPYDPNFEVFTAWDLGYGDSTAIWWLQFVGRELRWLEYYENSGELLPHYVKIIKEKPYNYKQNGHHLPFDGAAGNIRGEAVPIQLNRLGLTTTVLPKSVDLRADRELLNATIEFSVFDEIKTREGVFALESYHFEWDNDKMRYKKEPLHDWSSHGADAARYAAVAANRLKGSLIPSKPALDLYDRGVANNWMAY